ncbi:MAG: hypothetical protein V3V80_02950 [Dehalococcoidia bacterium]
MFKRNKTVVVALFADMHPNSTVGLLHPDGVDLDDGQKVRPSRAQHWLWRKWLAYWEFVADLKKKHRAEVWAICLGDGTDDNSHSKHGLITVNKATIVDLSVMVWEPILEIAEVKFVVRGTGSHTGGSGELEELVAKEIGAEKDDGNHSWWWLPLEAEGVLFDLAHHPGSTSRRPWTLGGGANRQAAILLHEYANSGNLLPQFGFRAHSHHAEDSGTNYSVRVLFLSPWQLTTTFGHRIGYSGRLEPVGGVAVVCNDGHGEVHVKKYRPVRRAPWTR